ncbi:putative inorganic carbon transporter subunit DabA [Legionella quateirensis]|nr:putative inorganic carbon transporter subunit DabA [Legionella quateirensis]STY18734.1 putative transmembrane protein [Legionella quateirensis]
MRITQELLIESINQAMEHIPEQGPLEYFVHHNTIHHYQHLEFCDAVKKAALDYQCNAFMPEEFYWQEYANRGINKSDLFYEIDSYIKKHHLQIPNHILYRLLIQSETANHYLDKQECESVRNYFIQTKKYFYHYALREESGIDIDHFIAPHLLKFMATYFDFGSAYWSMTNKKEGMWAAFRSLYDSTSIVDSAFLKSLGQQINNYGAMSPSLILLDLLKKLQINADDLPDYLFDLAYRFKGWSGMIKSLKHHPDWIKVEDIKPCFIELMTIIMLCEWTAIKTITTNLPTVPKYDSSYLHSEQFIHHFFNKLFKHPELQSAFIQALPFLDDKSRQEILHRSFERTFYNNFFNAYVTQSPAPTAAKPEYQVICCLDEREESFRRYLERDPTCETFGHAGHFGLNIKFKGYFDKHTRALCPVNATPEYLITENGEVNNQIGLKSLFLWGELLWLSVLSSKTILRSSVDTFLGCFLKVIPFSLDIISPRLTAKVKHSCSKLINNTVHTELVYKKEEWPSGMDLQARINLAYNLLATIGLTQNFGTYVIIMGHGSSSLNNPHEAAYDCGACGGGRGGANSRLMALLLNEPAVREQLKAKAIAIPEHTQFIGAYHNTCSDDITYYDIPLELRSEFKTIQTRIKGAGQLNAKERCRRFSSVPFGKSPAYYHRKVQERSIDLRQPRPEYGHSTNALCIIGPRSYSKNLFLDRRSFLISYDPGQDQDGVILNKILNTAGPVCAGINLEYYFSYIDNETYGCGTKLPHNVTSLIGVMNGYQSDLQNGLSSQMIEIHQPIRLCILVICSLSILKNALKKPGEFTELANNNWIKLSVHNTEDDHVYLYEDGLFEPIKNSNFPPTYFHQDEDVFNHANHLSFGHLTS